MIDLPMLNRLIVQSADPSKVSPFNYDRTMITLTPNEMLTLTKAVWFEAALDEREECAALCFEYTPHSFEGAETTAYELGVAIRERSNFVVDSSSAA